ncbi:MAG TPA: polysaccharide biosynthesis tyrosine autokinase [Armatimonadota bacterium]|nr:polysaccharide biosynthesis tyrosine autokinase [Armatimonadota bacterium]
MELWRYYRILRRRKWLIIIGTAICLIIVWGASYRSGQTWEAYTTVMEKSPGDEKISIFGGPLYQYDPKLRLANLSQLIKSRTVMERAAETLDREDLSSDPATVLGTLEATPLLDSSILVIKVQSNLESEAQATADVVATEFIRFYNELNYGGAARSREFIKSEVPKAEARLDKIRDDLRKFKEESGAVMITHQTDVLLGRLSQMQASLAQYEVATGQAQARLAGLKPELDKFPETRTASTAISTNPVRQSLEMDLVRQQTELQGMLRHRTRMHPEVQVLEKQIAQTETKLKEADETILASTVKSVDPVRDSLMQSYVIGLSEYSGVNAARIAAQQIVDSLKPELESLPYKEMRVAQLTLEEESAKNTYGLLRQKYDEAMIREKEAENLSSVHIVDTAKTRPADTRRRMKLGMALVLSLVFCTGVALLLNYLDNTVKTPAEAEELLKLPVFAVVPIARTHSLARGRDLPAMGSSYQMLSTNLLIAHPDLDAGTILVASAEPDVGRSTTAANLAITLARDGARVILVDSDLRQPSQHIIFGVENDKGLSNVLAGQLPLEDALQPTSVSDLLLLPSGPLPANPVRLFRSPEMARFVSAVNDLADFVIFDSPAGITFADSTLLAALVKNVVIVHSAGTVPRGAEEEFRSRLEQVKANMIGAVLNMVRPEDSHGYYHFRSAYEELMRDGKGPAALSGRAIGAIPEETSEEVDEAGTTDS